MPKETELFDENILPYVIEAGAKTKPTLKLIGVDSNAFSILGVAKRVADEYGMDWDEISKEATSGDYAHLIQTMMKYFEVI